MEPDMVSVKQINAAGRLQLRPVERNRILKIFVFKKFLSLKNQRNAGRGENHCRSKRGALARKPTVGLARPDFFGDTAMSIRHLIVRLGIDHLLNAVSLNALLFIFPLH